MDAKHTKHTAVATIVHAVRTAGLPIYKAGNARRPTVPGVAVRLGWRRGTVDVHVHGTGTSFADLTAAIPDGWRVIYTNEPGLALSIAPPR